MGPGADVFARVMGLPNRQGHGARVAGDLTIFAKRDNISLDKHIDATLYQYIIVCIATLGCHGIDVDIVIVDADVAAVSY